MKGITMREKTAAAQVVPGHKGPGEHPQAVILEALTNLHTATEQLGKTIVGDRGILLLGAVNRPLYGAASQKVSTSAGRLAGYSFRETSGAAPAVIRLRDGFDGGGDLIATIALPQATDRTAWFGAGISFGVSLYVEVVSGAVEGSVWLAGAK